VVHYRQNIFIFLFIKTEHFQAVPSKTYEVLEKYAVATSVWASCVRVANW